MQIKLTAVPSGIAASDLYEYDTRFNKSPVTKHIPGKRHIVYIRLRVQLTPIWMVYNSDFVRKLQTFLFS